MIIGGEHEHENLMRVDSLPWHSFLVSQKAAETSRKFSVFNLFSRCHSMYDQRYITPVEVDTLGKL